MYMAKSFINYSDKKIRDQQLDSSSQRLAIQKKLFPQGIPQLWCPTLSYFSAPGVFDAQRIEAHLSRLSPYVRGILVPGSTGEGWEMSDGQIRSLLDIVLPLAAKLDIRVLIGILKTETAQVLQAIEQLRGMLEQEAVVGITVCPAKGADNTQAEIHAGLSTVLGLGLPTALYQLPQVTQNEMSPETVSALAAEHANFILFKDTSGQDRVASSTVDLHGVFMVRGSEQGGYARWLKSAGGRYDGFLLSTANCFARELSEIVTLCDAGKQAEAARLSASIEHKVSLAFEAVGSLGVGNAFTNANKAVDHLRVYGSAYRDHPAPMLIGGQRLPEDVLIKLSSQLD